MTTISEARASVDVVVQPAITIDRLSKRYGDANVVDDLSFPVPPRHPGVDDAAATRCRVNSHSDDTRPVGFNARTAPRRATYEH